MQNKITRRQSLGVILAGLCGTRLVPLQPAAPDYARLTAVATRRRAIDAVNEFTRVKMKEESFYRRIIPQVAFDGVS